MTQALDLLNIDTSYDRQFVAMPQLTWLPWVGKQFGASDKRTMVLGESTYNWAPEKAHVAERIKSKDHLRILHQNHALNTSRDSKYVRNIERAIFQSKNPKANDVRKFWLSVTYHNLVLRPMATKSHRPHYADYLNGWAETLTLFRLLEIDRCLVYGLGKEKISSLLEIGEKIGARICYEQLSQVGNTTPTATTIKQDDHETRILFVRHPSAFFSWKKWGVFLKEQKFDLFEYGSYTHNMSLDAAHASAGQLSVASSAVGKC